MILISNPHSDRFLAAYSAADGNPYKIDLAALKKGFPPSLAEKLDLYIIDKNGVVINTTYSHDMGLDFKQWPAVFTQITAIREGNSFQSDRAVKGFHFDTVVRKFAYYPTPDHQYLLELSITIDEFHEERSEFSYGSAVRAIRESNPHILSITLYDTMLRKTYHSGQKPFVQSNATKDLVSQVFSTRQSISIQDQEGHTAERYIFIPPGGIRRYQIPCWIW
jgi:two-component system, NarL family, sensor histidine kinase BarA